MPLFRGPYKILKTYDINSTTLINNKPVQVRNNKLKSFTLGEQYFSRFCVVMWYAKMHKVLYFILKQIIVYKKIL